MSNSSLVSYTKLSPNCTKPRKNKILKITPHHTAGNISIEALGNMWANPNRRASSNYGIGSDGRIGLYVEECNRSWCSSSSSNDHQAITIEVANDGGAPNWHVSDKALESLIALCVDICKRNGIDRLNYTGDASGNLTRHNMFANTACPGPYLQSKFPYIAEEVNKRLHPEPPKPEPEPTYKFKIGDRVIVSGPLYVNSNAPAATGNVSNRETYVTRINPGSAHPYNTSGDLGWMNEDSIKLYTEPTPNPVDPNELHVGDTVIIRGKGNGNTAGTGNTAYGIGWKRQVLKIFNGKPYPYKVGNASGTTGFYKRESLEKC